MAVIVFTVAGLAVLLKICLPFNKYRAFVFAGVATVEVILLTTMGLLSYLLKGKELVKIADDFVNAIDFPSLTLVNWLVIGIMIVLTVATYLIISYVVEVLKGEHEDVKD